MAKGIICREVSRQWCQIGSFLFYLCKRDHKGNLPEGVGYIDDSPKRKHQNFKRKWWRVYLAC